MGSDPRVLKARIPSPQVSRLGAGVSLSLAAIADPSTAWGPVKRNHSASRGVTAVVGRGPRKRSSVTALRDRGYAHVCED